jgi:hypothetical protein
VRAKKQRTVTSLLEENSKVKGVQYKHIGQVKN